MVSQYGNSSTTGSSLHNVQTFFIRISELNSSLVFRILLM